MAAARFAPRSSLGAYEWDSQRKDWKRPPLDRDALKELSKRSTLNGLLRVAWFLLLLAIPLVATLYVSRISPWLAIPTLYVYWFFYGFWVCIAHELQHRTVFAENADWFSEAFFWFVQAIVWNSPTYARVSHKLHHRFTMVRGIDPETDWPETFTTPWLRRFLVRQVLRLLVVGAVYELVLSITQQVQRAAGVKDRMMREQCTEAEVTAIRWESLGILLVHAAVVAVAIVFRRWELLALVTIAWQLGSGFEVLWHSTEHIGRPYDVNDHRLNTRSIRMSRFLHSIYWGLDDHVDHHLWPVVPSRNLPRLHALIEKDLPAVNNILGCWAEMWEITGVKDKDPSQEFVATGGPAARRA